MTRTLAAALLLVLFGISGGGQSSEPAGGAVLRLNRQILTFLKTDGRNASDQRPLRALLAERAQQWKRLAALNPQAALDAVLPPEVRAAVSAESSLVESAGEWSGEFERWIADDFDNSQFADHYGMRIGGRTVSLHFRAGSAPPSECGGVIRIKGAMLDHVAAVREAVWERPAGACPRTGEQKVAAILVNLTDAQLPAGVTNASVRSLLFGGGPTLDSYWREASYGKTSAAGDVFGPFNLNMTYQCNGNDILNSMQPLLDAAIAAADPQVDFRQYNRLLLIVPRDKFCNLGGFATLGCSALSSSDGTFQASRAFVRADAADLSTIAHEMGHTLGLGHSGALYYSGEPVGPLGSLITPEEYGNPWDVMGGGRCANANLTGHYASRHKYGLGWLADSNLQTTESNGVYAIQPIETASSGVQALRVRRGAGNDHYLWIEYRRPLGFDTSMQTCSDTPFGGVLLFYEQPAYSGDNRTRLLDFGNSLGISGNVSRRAYRAALKAGQKWTDPYTQLSIEVLSAGDSASVRVNYDTPCAAISPASATFQPPPQQGSISVVAPGSCNVQAISNDPSWITITGGGGFTGNGTVAYSLSNNMLPQRRTSSISVGRQTFLIVQNADNGQPAPVSVSPSSGSSGGGIAQRFQFRFTDPDGGSQLTEVSAVFNSLHSLVGGCYFSYFPESRFLRLYGDDGGSWNAVTIGAPQQTLSNGQCSLNVATATALVSGVNVDLAVTVTFDGSFAGAKGVYLSAKDSWDADSGRMLMGSWTVGSATCVVSGSAGNTSFGSGGESAVFQIQANLPSCPWSITGVPSWITVNQTSGSGGASVGFTVAANTGAARSATLSVAGTSITISQAAAACSVSGSATATGFGSGGGNGTFQVSANLTTCGWTITGPPAWITVNQTSGSGAASIGFAVGANTGAARSATLNVAGTSITITQAAAACTVSGSASATGFGSGGGNGTFQISANLTTCAWSITGAPSWITVNQASGSGAASIGFAVGANTGAARSATLSVAGTSITITQAAAGCTISGSATATGFGSGGGNGTFQISANLTTCAWSITGAPSWITVNQTSGSGAASIGFAIGANTGAARSATLSVAGTSITITQAAAGCAISGSAGVTGFGSGGGNGTFQISANLTTCAWTITGAPAWITVNQTSGSGPASIGFAVGANTGAARSATLNVAGTSITVTQSAAAVVTGALRYVPVTPCRVADTRTGSGGSTLAAGTSRTIQMANSSCGLPATAKAYAVNVTVVPRGPLGFLTAWPTGQTRPLVSTLNSFEGSVVANSALVPAGAGGAIDLYASDATDLILDVNGYFTDQATASNLVFYPVTPCRVMDTRSGQGTSGSFGPPQPGANSTRTVPVTQSNCGIPTRAQAYSVNFTVVPARPLGFLSAYPSGQSRPLVSTLNSFEGRVVANGAIVPSGAGGAIDVFVTDPTDIIMDINGYFAPDDGNGLYFRTVTPCRAADTRPGQGTSGAFGPPALLAANSRSFPLAGVCGVPQGAQAYSMNVTVAPPGPLGYLTAWATGATRPLVSTLNSFDGRVVANAALVPAGTSGAVSLFVTDATHVILDLNGYFSR